MNTSYKKIQEIEELKKQVPSEWVHGGTIDFPELIYMKFETTRLAALQVAGEVTDTYSLNTAHNLIDYVLILHQQSDNLLQDSKDLKTTQEKLNKYIKEKEDLFNKKNPFLAIWNFFKLWKQHQNRK